MYSDATARVFPQSLCAEAAAGKPEIRRDHPIDITKYIIS